jgi:uncharacterized membrane protein
MNAVNTNNGLAPVAKNALLVLSIGAIALWVAATLTSIYAPGLAFLSLGAAAIAAPLFGLLHGARDGAARSVAMFVCAVVIANIAEMTSIATGFPFGLYHHNAAMGPQFNTVPLIVGPAFFGVCYAAWCMASLVTGVRENETKLTTLLLTSVLAALFAVGADICADPLGATLANSWTFQGGGEYFGVPVSNFVGWFLTTFAIFISFSALSALMPSRSAAPSQLHLSLPPILWALMAAQYLLLATRAPELVVHDDGGWAWRTNDIFQAAAINAAFTMMPVALATSILAWRSGKT